MKQNNANTEKQYPDFARIAAIYGFTTIMSSPPISLAMLTGSKMINEGQSFSEAVTNRTNIERSLLNPQAWGRTAARRLLIAPTVGESVKMASETFNQVPPIEKAIIYSFLSAFIGSVEAIATTKNEAEQILLSRDGVLPKQEYLKKAASAALVPSAIRNMSPAISLFTTKEIIAKIQEQNGGEPISKATATAIGICCGAVAGVLSLPANVATNMAIKTGEKPSMQDVFRKGVFTGWQGRAMQQGFNIGSILIAGLIIDATKDQEENSEAKFSSRMQEPKFQNKLTTKVAEVPSTTVNISTQNKGKSQLSLEQGAPSNPFL